jgi:hypothetical protein
MKPKLTFLLPLTLLFLFSGSVYGDDFNDGVDAHQGKDYKTAFICGNHWQNREVQEHKFFWVCCITTEKEFHKTTKKQSSGIDFQQNKVML